MADGVKLLNDERNAMVHSAWKKGPRHGVMTRIWPRVYKGAVGSQEYGGGH